MRDCRLMMATVAALAWLTVTGWAAPAPSPAGPGAASVAETKLRQQYVESRGKLAVDVNSRRVVAAGAVGAKRVHGKVVRMAGRRLILSSGDTLCAVLMRDPSVPRTGAELTFAARQSGTYRYRDASGIQRIPDYTDVTPSFAEFTAYKNPRNYGNVAPKRSFFKKTTIKVH